MSNVESNSSDQRVWIDSLPYIDPVHENYEQFALALVDEEMHSKNSPSPGVMSIHNFDRHVVKTKIIQNDYELLVNNLKPKDDTSINRPQQLPDSKMKYDESKDKIHRARALYESERLRSVQLEIDKEGSGSVSVGLKTFNEKVLSEMQKTLELEVNKRKAVIDDINFERQKKQQKLSQQLDLLSTKHYDLIDQHYQLREATATLENEIQSMSSR